MGMHSKLPCPDGLLPTCIVAPSWRRHIDFASPHHRTWDLRLCAAHHQLVRGAVEGHQAVVVQRDVQAAVRAFLCVMETIALGATSPSPPHVPAPAPPEHKAHDIALGGSGPQPHRRRQAAQQLLQVLRQQLAGAGLAKHVDPAIW